jgi:hypothetical protein
MATKHLLLSGHFKYVKFQTRLPIQNLLQVSLKTFFKLISFIVVWKSVRILYIDSHITASYDFLKSTNSYCTVSFYSHFFPKYLPTADYLISSSSISLIHTGDPH